jgi:hypothetical protein
MAPATGSGGKSSSPNDLQVFLLIMNYPAASCEVSVE